MKLLNDLVVKKFQDTCENIKNSENSDDLNFYVGVACGITSCLLLLGVIDFDYHTLMHVYIDTARGECNLGSVD